MTDFSKQINPELRLKIISVLKWLKELNEDYVYVNKKGDKITSPIADTTPVEDLLKLLLHDVDTYPMIDWWLYGNDFNIYENGTTTVIANLEKVEDFVDYMIKDANGS